MGLVDDLFQQPKKVLSACEALAPHLAHFAQATADPKHNVPIGFWMHRGCVPFINPRQFADIFWPTLKPVIQQLWAAGHQTLFYAEGNWDHHLEAFAELPDQSIIYHVDQGDIFQAHRVLGHKFCLSGGIPVHLLARGTPEQVRQRCKQVIAGVAREGGYIVDSSAIVQNDAKVENLRAMTDAAREYGVYSRGHAASAQRNEVPNTPPSDTRSGSFLALDRGIRPPGVCTPWDQAREQIPPIQGDERLCQRIWQSVDALGYMYIWWIALAF